VRAAFEFDPDRCTACEACRIACGIENNDGVDTGWRQVMTFNPARHPALPTRHLSLACNHCDTPACMLGCPAAAYHRDEPTGAVILDPEKCIGCRYCSWVCPYDAPTFDDGKGVMTKCTFCAPRLANGDEPACVAACPTDALTSGMRATGEPEPSYAGIGFTGLGPSLKVKPQRLTAPPPALAIDELLGEPAYQPVPKRKITLGHEWALLLFSLVMPALAAWYAGSLLHADRRPALIPFLAIGVLVMGLSTLHLGKPMRAWRAILNVKTSWLSREIFVSNGFLFLAIPYLGLPHASPELGIPAFLSGIAMCVSIDGVYRAIPRLEGSRFHSADALLTFVFLSGIVAGVPLVAFTAAAIKAALFLNRIMLGDLTLPFPAALARLVLLFLALAPNLDWSTAFALALVGEVIDRTAFYLVLEPASPARRMVVEAGG
jgi:Fe-S-cluster-containing dehydrogenase component/DMSO reductase anchor subunit